MKLFKPYDFIINRLTQLRSLDNNALWREKRDLLSVNMDDQEKKEGRILALVLRIIYGTLFLFLIILSYICFFNNSKENKKPATGIFLVYSSKSMNKKKGETIINAPTIFSKQMVTHASSFFTQKKIKSVGSFLKTESSQPENSFSSIGDKLGVRENNNKNVSLSNTSTTLLNHKVSGTVYRSQNLKIKGIGDNSRENKYLKNSPVSIALESEPGEHQTIGKNWTDLKSNSTSKIYASSSGTLQSSHGDQFVFSTPRMLLYCHKIDSIFPRHLIPFEMGFKHKALAKGFVVGAALNLNLPISRQEMSKVNINGTQNTLFDYLPSVYMQYHFNSKWFVQSELQWINPQYTPNLTLFNRTSLLTAIKKQNDVVSLNKL